MLVSVVMPVYNSALYVKAAILSICEQTFEDWELIIVDDCSSDNSYYLINSFFYNESRIKIIQFSENNGAALARNKAIEIAQGRYIAFLDSDDIWFPDKLEAQIQYMRKKDIAFSYSAYERINSCGVKLGVVRVPDKVSYSDLLKVCSVGCLTAIYDTKKLGKVYAPLVRKRQDLGLWLNILKKIPYGYAVPGILAQYRVRDDSISANKLSAALYTWKLYRDVEGLCFLSASYYFINYAINGLFRTYYSRLLRNIRILK